MPTYRIRGVEYYAHASRLRRQQWHPAFAWLPVITEQRRIAWLTTVMACHYTLLGPGSPITVRAYMHQTDYVEWRLTGNMAGV